MPPASDLRQFLRQRGELLERIRRFLAERGYLEVDTPCLYPQTVIDRHLEPVAVRLRDWTWFLQTSPELCMKRLLAAGSGPIFQIAHAFRAGEVGHLHRTEFTIVEWYATGKNYHELMDEVADLASAVLGLQHVSRMSYREAFLEYAQVDPFSAGTATLARLAARRGLCAPERHDRDELLDFLLATAVQPSLPADQLVFLYDFPATQAALACLRPGELPLAERFELFVNGVELCNGYQELADPDELARRMERENELRVRRGRRPLPPPAELIRTLRRGLPACSGVALGFDRLLMLALGASSTGEVIPIDPSPS